MKKVLFSLFIAIAITIPASAASYNATNRVSTVGQTLLTKNGIPATNVKFAVVSGAVGDYGFAIPIWTGGGSIPVRVIVPCTAGRIFKTNYNCTINAVTEFRFIYAQGEQ